MIEIDNEKRVKICKMINLKQKDWYLNQLIEFLRLSQLFMLL